jgi:flagellar hook protein FlgE
MFEALSIATGGMQAASRQLDTAAEQIASLGASTPSTNPTVTGDGGGGALPPAVTVDLSSRVLDVLDAQTNFALNAMVARTADAMAKQAIDMLV